MPSYRDRMNIIADILTVVANQAKKTQIMYRANLSYETLQRYLTLLLDASLVDFVPQKQRYMLTEKGENFLSVYQEYDRLNKSIESNLSTLQVKRKVLEQLCP